MNETPDTPPTTLAHSLELEPARWEARDVYRLMTSLVIPRPIAWVSSLSGDGRRNLAPHSYFNVVAHDPPHVIFSSSGVKDTLRNIRETGEFVVNVVSMPLVDAMNLTSADFPPEEDEFQWADLPSAPSSRVRPPRVRDAPAHLECRCIQVVEAGNGHVVIGEVVHIHVSPGVWRDGGVDPRLLDPVCRLAGNGYARLGECFERPRPSWSSLRPEPPPGATG